MLHNSMDGHMWWKKGVSETTPHVSKARQIFSTLAINGQKRGESFENHVAPG